MSKKLLISDIRWDTDGEDVNLPEEVLVKEPTKEMLEDVDGYGDAICDYLSDEYGFCVDSFNVKVIEPKKKRHVKEACSSVR